MTRIFTAFTILAICATVTTNATRSQATPVAMHNMADIIAPATAIF